MIIVKLEHVEYFYEISFTRDSLRFLFSYARRVTDVLDGTNVIFTPSQRFMRGNT